MIYIFGVKGNMAKRYGACLQHLGVPYGGCDIPQPIATKTDLEAAKAFIVATPTETHIEILKEILPYKKPILCEKPISKNLSEILALETEFPHVKTTLCMVNQYKYLLKKQPSNYSEYSYFKSGQDGLYWDCINIIGLAKKLPSLSRNSAIWKCTINGDKLSLSDMDHAYIAMLKDWTTKFAANWDYMIKAHEKVLQCTI
jgi:hypothetical protein